MAVQICISSLSLGLPRWLSGKEPACQCRRHKKCGFDSWVGKILWRRARQLTPVFLPGESHGQSSLEGYNPQGLKESDVTGTTQHSHIHTVLYRQLTTSLLMIPPDILVCSSPSALIKEIQNPNLSFTCSRDLESTEKNSCELSIQRLKTINFVFSAFYYTRHVLDTQQMFD